MMMMASTSLVLSVSLSIALLTYPIIVLARKDAGRERPWCFKHLVAWPSHSGLYGGK